MCVCVSVLYMSVLCKTYNIIYIRITYYILHRKSPKIPKLYSPRGLLVTIDRSRNNNIILLCTSSVSVFESTGKTSRTGANDSTSGVERKIKLCENNAGFDDDDLQVYYNNTTAKFEIDRSLMS